MKLTFYGGVGEVSGANYVLESGDTKIMIDCGLHQGSYFTEEQNWKPFKYDPEEISAVFITHAHIDHTGNLPKLVKSGFKGKIYSTPPTKDFTNLLLLDSEHILLQEAERLKKPALYGMEEVEKVMQLWEGLPYHQEMEIGPFKIVLYNAGHILGSSIVVVEADGRRIAFSGDLGNSPAPIIKERENLDIEIDYCLVESAYGNRLHPATQKGIIEDVIEDTNKKGGTLVIPAFAMERTQKFLFEINELMENQRVPKIPVFLDSPLAIKITEVYKKYPDYFDEETTALMMRDKNLFEFPGLRKTLTTEESKAINDVKPPKVIIAGAGMMRGGRILHHAKRYLPDPKSTIMFIGYQVKNSLGRRIEEGEKKVRIHGEEVAVRCRVVVAEEYSAHADQKQILEWLYAMRLSLKKTFVVQGEEDAASALAQKVVNDLAISAEIPKIGKPYEL
ncbi:MAG: MBL fold metallo-hydrolase [Candidatus Pacebacteria bacterium]|nr:MBL fold metallo-hydrolase [Candidatus Paceibacterota bacterium]